MDKKQMKKLKKSKRIRDLLKEMLSIDPSKRPSAEEVVKKAYTLFKKTA